MTTLILNYPQIPSIFKKISQFCFDYEKQWGRSPGKKGFHFYPDSDLFLPNEKKDIITSTVCWTAMAALLVALYFVMVPLQVLKLDGNPYSGFVMWLDFVTYLHHHGHEDKLPWYHGKEWSYLRGGLTTLDRDYGWINDIHHAQVLHKITTNLESQPAKLELTTEEQPFLMTGHGF